MRLIDADALHKKIQWAIEHDMYDKPFDYIAEILDAPSIDIVRCKECRWLRYCETEDLDLYLDCDKPDGGGIPQNEDWFCADGEREGE